MIAFVTEVRHAPLSARSGSPKGLLAPSSRSLTAIVSIAIPGAAVSPRPTQPFAAQAITPTAQILPERQPRRATRPQRARGPHARDRRLRRLPLSTSLTLGQVRAATTAVTSEGALQVAGSRARQNETPRGALPMQRLRLPAHTAPA
jgi:hypothetical protein